MYLEAFSAAKDPLNEHRNEDRLIVRSGRYYAVIDGVTDKSGVPLPNGSSRGQEAGRLIARALAELDDEDLLFTVPVTLLLERLEATFQARYRELGEQGAAAEDANFRYSAQLALAVPGPVAGSGERSAGGQLAWRLLVIGDCGVRIGGTRTLSSKQVAENVLAGWRGLVVTDVLARGGTVADALACGRHYCLEGTQRFAEGWQRVLPLSDWERLRVEAETALAANVRGLPPGTLAEILQGGVRGAARYRNASGPLGQACIDGFAVPLDKVVEEVVEHGVPNRRHSSSSASPGASDDHGASAGSLELFTDGYFGTPPALATRVADWEDHLAAVERQDPLKIDAHPATKGSSPGAFTDDRTVLVLATGAARAAASRG